MGSENADLPVEVGCNAVLDIVDHLKPEDRASFSRSTCPSMGGFHQEIFMLVERYLGKG
jgi:hypothetical protein